MKRIGILGGAFDPVHIGHLALAEWAFDALSLDEIWFIPTGTSHIKSHVLPAAERLHMTELAVMGNMSFRCLDIEAQRSGCTYSYETMEQLKGMYPEDDLYFIMGADCLFNIENWMNPDRIFRCCTLAAAVRGGVAPGDMEEKKRRLEQKYRGQVVLFPFPGLSVSSTEIRRRIREGKSVRYLVPDSVLAYIKEKGFYSEKDK